MKRLVHGRINIEALCDLNESGLSPDDISDRMRMDAGEVTLVNHNSIIKIHLLSQTGFSEDQLSLSDHQVSNNFLSLINVLFRLKFSSDRV